MSDQQHKFHPSHQLLSPKKPSSLGVQIDVPPRKQLLTCRATVDTSDMYSDDTILQKYLPYKNSSDSDDSEDPYSSDRFRMYEFKVRRCTRSRSHDWTDCPFAHPGEKARRRDPQRFHYSGIVCPEYRRGGCSRGDSCEYAHGVFECWLHPSRYRTEACKDGKNCKRKVCFFAHTPRQLRILPVTSNEISCGKKSKLLSPVSRSNSCCAFCHCGGGGGGSTASPTSTLFGLSHFSSPPLSPSSSAASPPLSPLKPRNGVCPVSRYGRHASLASYKDVLAELMNSFEGLSFGEGSSPVSAANAANFSSWLDVLALNSVSSSSSCFEDQQKMFTQNPTSFKGVYSNENSFYSNDNKVVAGDMNGCCPAPDLGWVNDLLM
ncbi:zinc finger CCCH domain-containing protein 2 isoform X1 [Lotus japonicus]|uniref:zinc finger CCCH domain-containing protein 2 isoform X1 n=1 Tax=Lotus japonicus TaxID=34305 RepID=UPI00258A8540|nr:zinc finger CCCH domain-containing protein 2 isoform X1 [Lotus japonicus]